MPSADDATNAARGIALGRLSPAERFVRALTLSAYVRQLAWQGARRHSGENGESAIVDRFLTQLYGVGLAGSFRTAIGADDQRHV